ncbi:hypothetical protein KCU62_g497, partial [Aureobasidium sp. EXF-3399]
LARRSQDRRARGHGVFLWDFKVDSWFSIRIVSAFAGFLVCETHGVHGCIVLDVRHGSRRSDRILAYLEYPAKLVAPFVERMLHRYSLCTTL